MAPAKTKSTASTKTSRNKSARTRQRSESAKPEDRELPAMDKDSQHHRWMSLDKPIELDWDKYIRWTVSKPTLLRGKIHIVDHDYEIAPVRPFPDEHATLELSAGDRFLIVPIKETKATSEQRRSLLVREEDAFDNGRLVLVDAVPFDDNATYQRIYVIGDDDAELKKQKPRIIGAVEAILQEEKQYPVHGDEFTTLKFIPAYSNFAGVSEEDKAPNVYGVFESEPRYEEFVEVGEFSINGMPYTLRPIDTKSTTSKTFRLKQGYQYFAIQVQGDSMEPTIFTGEYALVRSQKQPDRDGQIVAVNIGHQTVSTPTTALIKRLSKIRDGIRLESDNPRYSPQEYTKDDVPVVVLGIVEAVLSPASAKFLEAEQLAGLAASTVKRGDKSTISTITLMPPEKTQHLTPDYLAKEVSPYLCAIADIQRIIDTVRGQESSKQVTIISITQGSINVGLEGGDDALKMIRDGIVPWRKVHEKEIARLAEEKLKAEIREINARANRENQVAQKTSLEIAQLKQALVASQLKLAAKMAAELHGISWHDLPEDKKLDTINLLLASFSVITESRMRLLLNEPKDQINLSQRQSVSQ